MAGRKELLKPELSHELDLFIKGLFLNQAIISAGTTVLRQLHRQISGWVGAAFILRMRKPYFVAVNVEAEIIEGL